MRCQASADVSSEGMNMSRRAAMAGTLALAFAAALQSNLPAEARVLSSDWEKVDLPVDPGVVLLDIGFTDDKHGVTPSLALNALPVQAVHEVLGSPKGMDQWISRTIKSNRVSLMASLSMHADLNASLCPSVSSSLVCPDRCLYLVWGCTRTVVLLPACFM